MKPVSLCARAINDSSKRDDVVAEPFCGSGSTLVACEQRAARVRDGDRAEVRRRHARTPGRDGP